MMKSKSRKGNKIINDIIIYFPDVSVSMMEIVYAHLEAVNLSEDEINKFMILYANGCDKHYKKGYFA